ncbi:MAG: hypothetical protein ACAH18_11890 [Methylophilaceae bacterium]
MNVGGTSPARADAVVLFLAHQWSEAIGQRFARLRRELSPFVDCFVLLQNDQGDVLRSWTAFLHAIGASDALVPFLADELPGELGLRYFGENRIMGNTHFPLLRFARSRRYRHYWQVESDVEYRGNWLSFFGAYRECETPLLASHIHRYHDWPTWHWWHSFAVPTDSGLALANLYKAFFPVFRISPPAIEAVEQAHRAGWLGHFEVVVPTAVTRAGLGLQDLCAINPCYVGASQNPCAILPIQSTLRWRPEVSVGEFWHRGSGALIFHPVKDNWSFDGEKIVRM